MWNDPVYFIAQGLRNLLTGWGLPLSLVNVILSFIGITVTIIFALGMAIFLIWVERKVVARFQDRLGPNRIGPFGLFQPFADIIKLIIKEDITPALADKPVFNLSPVLALTAVLLLWAIFPLAPNIYGVDLNVAVLYVVATGALGSLSIIMAGWASNNKYALLGAFRMVANMISYEIPMVLSLLIPTLLAGTMSVKGITEAQSPVWFFFLSPLGALIFFISAVAELGRAPFDLNEAESELVSGFNIEYSGMKFGLFFAAELLHAFTFGGFTAVLFFGGYHFFGLENLGPLVAAAILLAKAMLGYWIIMWIKYTMPRIRIDHMLAFNWKFLTPLALVVLIVTAVLSNLLAETSPWTYSSGLFLANLAIALVTVTILRATGRRQQRKAGVPAGLAPQTRRF